MQKKRFYFLLLDYKKKKTTQSHSYWNETRAIWNGQIIIEKWEKKSSIDMKSWEYNGIIRLCYK